MNIRRFFTSVIILSIFSGMFAQQSVDLDLKGSKNVRISLGGPAQTVPVNLLLNVTYQPEEEIIKIVLKGGESQDGSRISSTNKKTKEQITHLLFLFDWNGFTYHDVPFKKDFKEKYNSSVVLETPMKEQIDLKSDNGEKTFRPTFEIDNGKIEKRIENDFIVSLEKGILALQIKVLDLGKPVTLTINNVIPFRAEKEWSLYSNKFFLKYISNSTTITFNIPEDKCAKQYDRIHHYETLNSEMSGEVKRLKEYVSANNDDINRIVQRQWPLIIKYEKTRKDIDATVTECERLSEQFADFNDNYSQIIGVNDFTPDSLERVISKLYSFRYLLLNSSVGTNCEELKDQAAEYIADVVDHEEAINSLPEAQNLVRVFNQLKKDIDSIGCPVEVIDTVVPVVEEPVAAPKPAQKKAQSRCSDAAEKFDKAARRIDSLIDVRRAHSVDNSSEFNSIVKKMDSYWNGLDESCKKQCSAKYDIYEKMKSSYKRQFK